MTWAAVAIGGSALVGAGASIYAGNKAAGAARSGANTAAQAEREALATQVMLQEPQRYLGYQALGDLSQLYGYGMAPYQTGGEILSGSKMGFDPLNVDGKGGKNPVYGGMVNPQTGEVIVYRPGTAERDEALSSAATNYLRTGQGDISGYAYERIRGAIDQLRGGGYKYQPTQQGAGMAGTPTGQAGNFSRFYTSPDYQFRVNQGVQALDRSAAARGRLRSGAQMKAVTDYGQQAGSQEFGNYFERLSRMAGMGGAATNAVGTAASNAAGGIGAAAMNAGNATAGQYMNAGNQIGNLLQQGAGLYAMYRGGYFNRPPGG